MIVDALTAGHIGAGWLDAQLTPVSEAGRSLDETTRRYGPGDERAARAACAQVLAVAATLAPAAAGETRAALAHMRDVRTLTARARLGDVLGDADFFTLAVFAAACGDAAHAWTAGGGPPDAAPLRSVELDQLLAPGSTRSGGFYLDDAFDDALAAARGRFTAADSGARAALRRLSEAVAPALGFTPDADEFITLRDAVPDVPAGVRIVHETPAYRVLALEADDAARTAETEREAALAEVAACELAVRRRLSEAVARGGAAIDAAAERAAFADRLLARVAFVQQWGGAEPAFCAGRLAFEDATYAPLAAALVAEGLPYAPVSLDLSGAGVLTGPNMGGKTAALSTCGFMAACVARGVPPPARAVTLPPLGSVVWVATAGEDAAAPLLSAFAAEVVRARDLLAKAARPALVLVDEFARTTAPREGRALLTALVEALAARGDVVLAATHLDGVAPAAAHFTVAGVRPGALRAEHGTGVNDALAAVRRAMDYRIVPAAPDGPPDAHALDLAAALGLDAAVVERARALVREESHVWSR